MYELISISTEQTTAATDLLLAIVTTGAVAYLHETLAKENRGKVAIWAWAFVFLTVAAALGAIVHGLRMTPAEQRMLWNPLYLALSFTVASFAVGAIYDFKGPDAAHKVRPLFATMGLGVFALLLLLPDGFTAFLVYETVIMVSALLGYIWLSTAEGRPGADLMSWGILFTIVAAAIQATKALTFTFIWPFDHNSVFHLLQIVGVALIIRGIRNSLLQSRA